MLAVLFGCGPASPFSSVYADPTASEQARQAEEFHAQQARLAQEQQKRAAERSKLLSEAQSRCDSGDDTGCAVLMDDDEQLNDAIRRSDSLLIQRSCDGGSRIACTLIESQSKANTFGPRQLAALERVQALGDQWAAQLDALSKQRCAVGEEAQIEADWQRSLPRRQKQLDELDEAMKDAQGWADMWKGQREYLDARVRVALGYATKCEDNPGDNADVALDHLLQNDPARNP